MSAGRKGLAAKMEANFVLIYSLWSREEASRNIRLGYWQREYT